MFVNNPNDFEVTTMWDSISYAVPAKSTLPFSDEVCRKFQRDNPSVKLVTETPKNDVPEAEIGQLPEGGTGQEPVIEDNLEDLQKAYTEKFGKKLVGKWAKDTKWIKSKLNEDGNPS